MFPWNPHCLFEKHDPPSVPFLKFLLSRLAFSRQVACPSDKTFSFHILIITSLFSEAVQITRSLKYEMKSDINEKWKKSCFSKPWFKFKYSFTSVNAQCPICTLKKEEINRILSKVISFQELSPSWSSWVDKSYLNE